MLRCIALAAALVSLAACAPSQTAVSTAIAQTQAAAPSATPDPTQTPIPTITPQPTATLIPLADLDIESLLLVDGDLPRQYVAGQIKDVPPRGLRLPPAAQLVSRSLSDGTFGGDGVTVALYESADELAAAYEAAVYLVNDDDPADVGERAQSSESHQPGGIFPDTYSTRVAFVRCQAVVYVHLFAPTADIDTVLTYARRLDRRLTSVVCR